MREREIEREIERESCIIIRDIIIINSPSESTAEH